MTILAEVMLTQLACSKQPSNITLYMEKGLRDKEKLF